MSNILDTLNPPTTPKPVEDCVSCRVIGGLTLTALGGYGIGQAITQGKVLSRAAAAGTPPVPGGPTKRGLAIMAFFGVGATIIGMGRFAGIQYKDGELLTIPEVAARSAASAAEK